jgi:hypothetical protein
VRCLYEIGRIAIGVWSVAEVEEVGDEETCEDYERDGRRATGVRDSSDMLHGRT